MEQVAKKGYTAEKENERDFWKCVEKMKKGGFLVCCTNFFGSVNDFEE